jgi:hypothetical protein
MEGGGGAGGGGVLVGGGGGGGVGGRNGVGTKTGRVSEWNKSYGIIHT